MIIYLMILVKINEVVKDKKELNKYFHEQFSSFEFSQIYMKLLSKKSMLNINNKNIIIIDKVIRKKIR